MKQRNTMRRGKIVVLLAGLPKNTLQWVMNRLQKDTSLRPARYVGAPATTNDWSSLYKKKSLAEILSLIDRESRVGDPHRILVLYVPSRDAESLVSVVDTVCYLAPLSSADNGLSPDRDAISWRHDKSMVEILVYKALQSALKSTDVLKAEITDKRISAFTLPALNFHFPDHNSLIIDSYRNFARKQFDIADMRSRLAPMRFTKDNLHPRAFKGSHYASLFFQDSRGRVFPPDIYHAPNRMNADGYTANKVSLRLRQRYRFGVTVRDGNLHYDVQYELPRKLNREPMDCSLVGRVLVTGSHANVGVNDVIWAPDGRKVQVDEKDRRNNGCA